MLWWGCEVRDWSRLLRKVSKLRHFSPPSIAKSRPSEMRGRTKSLESTPYTVQLRGVLKEVVNTSATYCQLSRDLIFVREVLFGSSSDFGTIS